MSECFSVLLRKGWATFVLGFSVGPDDEEEDDYDSADTDELIASRKPPPPPPQQTQIPSSADGSGNNKDATDRKRKTTNKRKAGEEEDDSDEELCTALRTPSSTQQRGDSPKPSKSQRMVFLPAVKPNLPHSDSDDEDEDEDASESANYSSDSDYEAMFSNVTHLEISLADLQRLAEESAPAPSSLGSSSEKDSDLKSGRTPKKGTTPEEILASLMEDSSEDEARKKKKKRKGVTSAPLPAFQGTAALRGSREEEEKEEEEEEGGDNFFRVNWLKISGHIYQGNLFISYYWTNFEQSPYGFKTQFCYFK